MTDAPPGSQERAGPDVRGRSAPSRPRPIAPRWAVLAAVSILAVLGLSACAGGGGEGAPFPVSMSAEQVSLGRQVYATNCTACHGEVTGRPTLPVAPPHGADGHTWHHDDRQLFEWILDGPPVRTIMPAFRGVLSDVEVTAVLAYMKSEWPSDIRDTQTRQTAEYERGLLEQERLE